MASTFTGAQRPVAPAYGCTVILGEGPGEYTPLTLARGGKLENRFGAFQHADFVGVPYGSKVFSKSRHGGFVHLLPFTPELWTHALTHRTQILFSVDIAQVALHLGLRPGSVVVESGTGSGSLTTTLARAVAPHGHVHTFEFNADRARKAAEDFARTGMAHVATVEHRDVCGAGFGAHLAGAADGVFLDLPQPWLALPHARAVLRAGGMLCSYSPCMEQVQRTCVELRALGFDDVRTIETLLRPLDVSTHAGDALQPPPHLHVFGAGDAAGAAPSGAALPAAKRARPGDSVSAGGGSSSVGAGSSSDGRSGAGSSGVDSGASNQEGAALAGTAPGADAPLASSSSELDSAGRSGAAAAATEAASNGAVDSVGSASAAPPAAAASGASLAQSSSSDGDGSSPFPALVPFPAPNPAQRAAVIPAASIRGHTAYLTFATLFRKDEPEVAAASGIPASELVAACGS